MTTYRARYGKRKNRAEALGSTVSRLTKPFFVKRGLADGAIAREWTEIVGPMIASHSRPDRITYQTASNQNGLLHLKVDHSAMATELQHLEPQLLERINSYFGFKAVAKMHFTHGPLAKEQSSEPNTTMPRSPTQKKIVTKALSGIADQELREALNRLGNALYQGKDNGE